MKLLAAVRGTIRRARPRQSLGKDLPTGDKSEFCSPLESKKPSHIRRFALGRSGAGRPKVSHFLSVRLFCTNSQWCLRWGWLVILVAVLAIFQSEPRTGFAQTTVVSGSLFRDHVTTWLDRIVSILGIFALLGLAWLLSINRKAIPWRTVAWGVGLQILFALVVLNPAIAQGLFTATDTAVRTLLSFSEKGADFVFQSIHPHEVRSLQPDGSMANEIVVGRISPALKTVAFWVLPSIIFFSAMMTLLYHLGIMQLFVRAIAWIMQRTMRTSGAETLSAAGNIFLGQTEAPLLIKPYVGTLTQSELNSVMVGGFATVAGGVMAAYVSFLRDIPGIAGHLVTASIMSAPAALAVAKIIVPETETPLTRDTAAVNNERPDANAIEALARGSTEGMQLFLNVIAMLIGFVAAVALIDWLFGFAGTSFSQVLGWLFSPIAFVMGVPWEEAGLVGQLLGEKLVLTEFLAYKHLGEILGSGQAQLSERSAIIASYACCGFANFASIGIQIGGIGGIAPHRRTDLARLGIRAMLGGSIAAFLTATIAGILL